MRLHKYLTSIVSASLFAFMTNAQAAGISVDIHGSQLTASADNYETDRMKLRVAGPGDFSASEQSEGRSLSWVLPATAPDGLYRYDVYAASSDSYKSQGNPPTDLTATQGSHKSGKFKVSGGTIVLPGNGEKSASYDPGMVGRALAAIVDSVIPVANAADVTASSGVPTVNFEDTDLIDHPNTWDIESLGNQSDCNTTTSDNQTLRISDRSQNNRVVSICAPGDTGDTVPNSRSLVVDVSGDITLADGDAFLDRSTNRLGIGTTTPSEKLHISGGFLPAMVIEDTSNGELWRQEVGDAGVWFVHETSGNDAVKFQNGAATDSLVVAGQEAGTTPGDIGIGTNAPAEALHVSRSDGSAKILVEESSGTTSARQLYTLQNNGPIGFGMVNTDTTDEWRFAAQTTGFRVSLGGSGGPEFEVEKDGSLRVGGGSSFVMNLDGGTGNMSIDGTLTEGSSRAFKTAIESIDPSTVLSKLAKLPLAEWSYKKSDMSRHLGPMAEDFYELFGLGPDEKHIAPKDLAGVAMASAKALKKELDKKEERIEQLEAKAKRVDELEARLDRIEDRVLANKE